MASSRWKRFAFFEKNQLSLPSEVLEDLIPAGESSAKGRGSSRRSINSLSESSEASSDRVNLVVTTAALPLDSKPSASPGTGNSIVNPLTTNNDYNTALDGMWSSVTACNPMESFPVTPGYSASDLEAPNIYLPSQAQAFEDDSNVVSSETAVDGLVLAFVTSRDTDRVHCFDISVRCNNKTKENDSNSNDNDSTKGVKSGKKRRDLEDLDGWRGYLAPMKLHQKGAIDITSEGPTRSPEELVTNDLIGGPGKPKEGIVAIATCRARSGHRAIHMACITANNVVVCVDPHLYLSW